MVFLWLFLHQAPAPAAHTQGLASTDGCPQRGLCSERISRTRRFSATSTSRICGAFLDFWGPMGRPRCRKVPQVGAFLYLDVSSIPSGNQTWLAGKSSRNGALNGKIMDTWSIFSSTVVQGESYPPTTTAHGICFTEMFLGYL